MSNLGYPGVNGPGAPKPKEKTVPVRVLGEDAVNALVQHQDGRSEIVDKKNLRR